MQEFEHGVSPADTQINLTKQDDMPQQLIQDSSNHPLKNSVFDMERIIKAGKIAFCIFINNFILFQVTYCQIKN